MRPINKFSKDTLVIGKYEQGEKVGIWSYLGENNSLYIEYDYDQNKLLKKFESPFENDSIQIKTANTFKLAQVDHPPLFIGYKNELKQIIKEELKLPATSFQAAISGMVVISVEINKKGEAVNFKIENSYDNKINDIIENSIIKIQHKWIPAAINGIPVVSKIYILYNFSFVLGSKNVDKSKIKNKANLIVIDMEFYGIIRKTKVYSH